MINNWWVTRPQRKLNNIPGILMCCAEVSLNQEWTGNRNVHLLLEESLENAKIKRVGTRRDQTGGGGRTYLELASSLGLVFMQEETNKLRLTLAGEAIMAGDPPVAILKHQILRYQFPSSYSLSRGVRVNERFKIRPFRFLLRLLSDSRVEYLTHDEIGKVVIVEADNETDRCYSYVVDRVIAYRQHGDSSLAADFAQRYPSSRGVNLNNPYDNLLAVANTIQIWIEYTQLAKRDDEHNLRIIPEKADEVATILSEDIPFIDRPESHEYFQRKYGVDPKHRKDTRNLLKTEIITAKMLAEHKIKQAFITESLKHPISKITIDLIDRISENIGEDVKFVEETLIELYPRGAVGSFMSEYFEMAFRGRDNAMEFELATVELFKSVFGFQAHHVGSIGLTPDVLLLSDEDGYCGIIDNKAYSKYAINNDHRNRMITNYIGGFQTYYNGSLPLSFFSYIAGGFGTNIDVQIADIVRTTSVHGSAISVHNVIKLAENHVSAPMPHSSLREIFSVDRQILLSDVTG